MHLRTRHIGAMAILASAACLLGWPAFAAATPQTAEGKGAGTDTLQFLLTEGLYPAPASQAEAGGARSVSRLAVRLYGGISRLAAGDVNDGSDGFFEILETYGTSGLGTLEGRYRPVHYGMNFGGDVVYQISPRIGVGLGAGYLRSSRSSLMSITAGTESITVTASPTLSAVPLRLGVFGSFPVARRLDLTADAGATWFAALKLEASQSVEFEDGTGGMMSLRGSRGNIADNLGFQGSLGIEYRMSPRMGVFVEAAGRYARFKNFETVTGTSRDFIGGGSETTVGKLYIVTNTSSKGSSSMFTVEETPPVDTAGETFREPKIDLSGFSLQAGIRIRL